MNQSANEGGTKSAAAPRNIKHKPISGTAGTENIPPVTTPVPYRSSHTPGIALVKRARIKTIVNTAPAISGGDKLKIAFRPGPDIKGMFTARALRSMDQPTMSSDIKPSAIHTASHATKVVWNEATRAATKAVPPMATSPHPGTPVKAVDRSIVSRM